MTKREGLFAGLVFVAFPVLAGVILLSERLQESKRRKRLADFGRAEDEAGCACGNSDPECKGHWL